MSNGADHGSTYPPLDVLKPVTDNVWIVDSGPLRALGMPLPIRMTVIRLANGDVFLHSPTRFDSRLKRQIDDLGQIGHLIAPDVGHWSFLQEWQHNCPGALTWAAPGLRQRAQVQKAALKIDRDLADEPPGEWASEIDQTIIRGALFSEVDFFHRPTKTLILTDLIVNIEPQKMPPLARMVAHLAGHIAPNGRTPRYLRLVIMANRREARLAASRMVAWAPERVVFSHGRWFERDGTAALRQALGWLVG